MGALRGSTLTEVLPLADWSFACHPAEHPKDLQGASWLVLESPTTVAAALRSHGHWDFDRPRAFDAETWWFRARVPALVREATKRNVLVLEGLATLADVFLDGVHVLRSENMFHEHRIDLDDALRRASLARVGGVAGGPGHELAIRFAPVNEALALKRPRPRWKTRLAAHQQLRWIRTSLVGRMPGWSPPVPPVGPWRPIVIERCSKVVVSDARVHTRVVEKAGIISVTLRLASLLESAKEISGVLVVGAADGEVQAPLEHARDLTTGEVLLTGQLAIPSVALWWPHTHGAQPRLPARVTLMIDGVAESIDLGLVAFRTVQLDTQDRGFSLVVNGVPVFCRGACWTTTDIATLTGTPEEYRRVLRSARDAGMNMLRISGTLFYEADAFYETCDELGILVWQDFMFANMDYPIGDAAFRASVTTEARAVLERLQSRPCLAVLCGGSEVEQQAAMFGAPREIWRGPLFDHVLPDACASFCPDVPYWPNSPSGGALPFHVDEGASHYYGVGAYLRPFDDARRSRVKFASECLAFANVPEDDLFPLFLADGQAPFVSAKWKERTSKDNGSGWDFEDVRDHYTALLFGVDPMRVRYEDMDRYLALSRVTSGEVMARVYAELRRGASTCRGGLVWFLQDLWPGAGWGVLDSRGRPKSPYWFLKRALQPLALSISDEGVNGLHVHVVNDHASRLEATLRVTLYRDGEVRTGQGAREVVVPARGTLEIAADALLETFADTARAYRFGPPAHDIAVATLLDAKKGDRIAECVHLHDFARAPACGGFAAALGRTTEGALEAVIQTRRFAHAVTIAVRGYVPDDNYFDLPPSGERRITLRPIEQQGAASGRAIHGTVSALNLPVGLPLTLPETTT